MHEERQSLVYPTSTQHRNEADAMGWSCRQEIFVRIQSGWLMDGRREHDRPPTQVVWLNPSWGVRNPPRYTYFPGSLSLKLFFFFPSFFFCPSFYSPLFLDAIPSSRSKEKGKNFPSFHIECLLSIKSVFVCLLFLPLPGKSRSMHVFSVDMFSASRNVFSATLRLTRRELGKCIHASQRLTTFLLSLFRSFHTWRVTSTKQISQPCLENEVQVLQRTAKSPKSTWKSNLWSGWGDRHRNASGNVAITMLVAHCNRAEIFSTPWGQACP